MVESGGLENRCAGNPGTEGSNPSPSAIAVNSVDLLGIWLWTDSEPAAAQASTNVSGRPFWRRFIPPAFPPVGPEVDRANVVEARPAVGEHALVGEGAAGAPTPDRTSRTTIFRQMSATLDQTRKRVQSPYSWLPPFETSVSRN